MREKSRKMRYGLSYVWRETKPSVLKGASFTFNYYHLKFSSTVLYLYITRSDSVREASALVVSMSAEGPFSLLHFSYEMSTVRRRSVRKRMILSHVAEVKFNKPRFRIEGSLSNSLP